MLTCESLSEFPILSVVNDDFIFLDHIDAT